MKLRIQIGIESFKGEQRTLRLTPIDKTLEVPEEVGSILMLVAGTVDLNDGQPGDGEYDFKIGDLRKVKGLPAWLKPVLDGLGDDSNAFLRFKKAG